MAIRQKTKPNLDVPARRGWCLQYVDDSIKAPYRQPTAQAAWNVEKANGNTRTSALPVKLWVPIFFSFGAGAYKGIGHVAWAYNRGDGTVDIIDSEVRTGARSNYNSIQELLNWFSASQPKYLGWSYWVDGRQVLEDYTPPPVITTKEETTVEVVPFEIVVVDDPTLPVGRTNTTPGVNGERTITWTVTYSDGKETSRKIKSDKITVKPVDMVKHIGTYIEPAPSPTPGGEPEPAPEHWLVTLIKLIIKLIRGHK